MEIDENNKKADTNEISMKRENEENFSESSNKECDEAFENNDNFKKPTLVVRGPAKKSALHKYLQQNKLSEGNNKIEDELNQDIGLSEPIGENDEKKNCEIKSKSIPLPYIEPEWKGFPEMKYELEELKSGVIERTIDLQEKSFVCFGRLETCDICMAHPTVSRFHAILQYREVEGEGNEKGFYLYDLKSTHGTFLNKYRIKPNVYARVKVGHMIKIGCSTRFFILKGPAEDEEEESPMTVTDLKLQRQAEIEERKQKEEEEKLLEEQERERQERLIEERGISWGMAEDADEETDLSENPYAQVTNEELYIDDPKKALRNWFEREGEELIIDTEKAEKGLFLSKVVLPIDDGDGKEIVVEMTGRSKKEAQFQCSMEACRTIDKMGLLRPAKREAKRQQKRNWEENDYYDSDEDSFLDRTGDLEKKREKRMRKAGKIKETIETYETLTEKHKVVLEKLEAAESKLNKLLEEMNDTPPTETLEGDVDSLDAYMVSLKKKKPKKLDIKIAKSELSRLQEEETNLRKLINIAKPANIPELILKKTAVVETSARNSAPPSDKKDVQIENVHESPTEEIRKESLTVAVENNTPVVKKSERVIGPIVPQGVKFKKEAKAKVNDKSKSKTTNKQEEKDFMEDDVYSNCVWKPPPGQTGDGKTALNEKYGY